MDERPALTRELDVSTFRSFYYLKKELVRFSGESSARHRRKTGAYRKNRLFPDTGRISERSSIKRKNAVIGPISESTPIEPDIVCSEKHRAFFVDRPGKSFSFNVAFQKWRKSNPGKTYGEALEAYRLILAEKKKGKTVIGKQFEYNTYIRDFFEANPGKSLEEAILCRKFKKAMPGHNRYEPDDLLALTPPADA